MSNRFDRRPSIRPAAADRLYSVYRYALDFGYDDAAARRVALHAMQRYCQGGYHDFALVIDRIRRRATNALAYHAEDFNRLLTGHCPNADVDLRLHGTAKWTLCCGCDLHKQP